MLKTIMMTMMIMTIVMMMMIMVNMSKMMMMTFLADFSAHGRLKVRQMRMTMIMMIIMIMIIMVIMKKDDNYDLSDGLFCTWSTQGRASELSRERAGSQ